MKARLRVWGVGGYQEFRLKLSIWSRRGVSLKVCNGSRGAEKEESWGGEFTEVISSSAARTAASATRFTCVSVVYACLRFHTRFVEVLPRIEAAREPREGAVPASLECVSGPGLFGAVRPPLFPRMQRPAATLRPTPAGPQGRWEVFRVGLSGFGTGTRCRHQHFGPVRSGEERPASRRPQNSRAGGSM